MSAPSGVSSKTPKLTGAPATAAFTGTLRGRRTQGRRARGRGGSSGPYGGVQLLDGAVFNVLTITQWDGLLSCRRALHNVVTPTGVEDDG
ncbi:hypothetical protein HQQ86_16060 [Rathayibacter sp. VKM Ac-2857]|nr:hypothetical protein [Rathayibacter sp. VKM Ac-2857]